MGRVAGGARRRPGGEHAVGVAERVAERRPPRPRGSGATAAANAIRGVTPLQRSTAQRPASAARGRK